MALVYITALACANGADRGATGSAPATNAPPAAGGGPLVIFLGDSLTAGAGLPADEAFPALVAEGLRERGTPIRVVNAGVSGDTTAGGLERLGWLLSQKPDVLVVGLGYNDAFRGWEVDAIEKNLREIVTRAKAARARVLILGMKIPPNYGPDYSARFFRMYADVAKDTDSMLMPYLLEGVGGYAELNQDDGIHPNLKGEQIVAGNVLPFVERIARQK